MGPWPREVGDAKVSRRSIRRGDADRALLAIAGVLVVTLYAATFVSWWRTWATYEEYSYGFLVPFISLFLLWRNRARLRGLTARPDARGALVLGAGLVLFLLGSATGVRQITGASIVPVLLGLTLFIWGRAAARAVAFPVAYLLCGVAIVNSFMASLGFVMQGVTARYALHVANALGAHATLSGLTLSAGSVHLIVAAACSGMNSLLALLSLGLLLTGIGPGSTLTKAFLVIAIIPMVIVANIMRVALVLVIARDLNPAIADGFVHYAFGAAIFLFTLGLLLALRKVVLWRAYPPLAFPS